MEYAYFFNHRVGTPLRAAKGGAVSHAQSGKRECEGRNLANEGNHVTIRHGDGSATLYLHLTDVYVSPGQCNGSIKDV